MSQHAAAVLFALKNKMDLSLGVAVGSATQARHFAIGPAAAPPRSPSAPRRPRSTSDADAASQITLLGFPLSVVLAWGVGQPLSLDMRPFETIVFMVCAFGTVLILADGRAHWLKGLALALCYVVVALSFLCHVDADDERGRGHRRHGHHHAHS